ncbi:MAG: S9 family peptidase [Eubacteriales bacterium]|nr:S9 family peptidase [Eubacteriales bacterium]
MIESLQPITNDSLYELRNVAQPQTTGDRHFFTRTVMNREENRYDTHIYEYVGEGRIRAWGDTGSSNTALALSPDGRKLAFLSNAYGAGKPQLCVQDLSGAATVRLTDEKEGVTSFLWAADGGGLYYQTQVETAAETKSDEQDAEKEKRESTEMKKNWPQPTVITKKQYKFDGAGFLPEGRQYRLCYVQPEVIESWQTETLPGDEWPQGEVVMELSHSFTTVYLSTDGSFLLYQDREQPEDEWSEEQIVFLYDRKSKQSRPWLTVESGTSVEYLGAAPDGQTFVVSLTDRSYGFLTYPLICLYRPQNGELLRLNEDCEIDLGDTLVADFQQQTRGVKLQWPDEQHFIFLASEHGKTVLYQASVSGELKKVFDRRLHLTGAVVIDKASLLVTYSTTTTPSRLAILTPESGELTDIYDPNHTFGESHRIVTPEMFYFKGYDDWDIQAWYLEAQTEAPKHPAILYIHGGPQVAYGESFFHEMQALAAAGYGVLMVNPRGGSSYGQHFVASILGDYGNHDYDDLMMAVDEMLKRYPRVDADRLYVVGGSYGGFMTNWIVTHTDRFRAAVTQRSISNWLSFYGTSDIGVAFVKWQLQHELPDTKRLWEMSPIAYAAQAKTPLLVIHSDEDHRCPKEQGEQMYMAMKKYRVETKMITFPKSSHGLSRIGLPNLRQERLEAIRNWFDEHGGRQEER